MAKRLAVVIGNSEYENLNSLTTSTNDANAFKEVLYSLGYEVSLGVNLQKNEMLKCFTNILDPWKNKAIEIVVYYSGYGSFIDGKPYICPVDVDNNNSKENFLSVEKTIGLLLENRKKDQHPIIIILDCRYSKLKSGSYNQEHPLRKIKKTIGENTAILFSMTEVDVNAVDEYSLYTRTLLENIEKNLTIDRIHSAATIIFENSKRFRNKHMPWIYNNLHEPYSFYLPKPHELVKKPFDGVPRENHKFVDRPDIFADIEAFLGEKFFHDECRILALKGPAGTGKTQVMLQYCYIHRLEYDFIFWLEIDSRTNALESFYKLAVNLGLDVKSANEKLNNNSIIEWVSSWLEKKTGWLLLLNNADKMMTTEILKVSPQVGGHIIITTREPIPSTKAKTVRVTKMKEDEALSLLYGAITTKSIDKLNSQFDYAKKIVSELDFLPLAINIARAYISAARITFKDYLSIFRIYHGHTEISSHHDEVSIHQYSHSLATVWKISFERIRVENPVTLIILYTCAFLRSELIPIGFFERQYTSLENGLDLSLYPSDFKKNEHSWRTVRAAIAALIKFSLVTRTSVEDIGDKEDKACDTLTIHRLTQKIIYNTMNDDEIISWTSNLAVALNKEITSSDPLTMATRKVMSSHILHFVTLLSELRQDLLLSTDLEDLLVRTVHYLLENRIYVDAETLAKLAVSVSECIHGLDDSSTVKSLNCLARFYQERGVYVDAEPLHQRALTIRERTLGPEHPDTATSLNNLASLYDYQGKYVDAKPLYQRALTIYEKKLGPEHPYTASSLNNLALLYENQGKYSNAEQLYQRALTIREKALGYDHPHTIDSRDMLESLRSRQGQKTPKRWTFLGTIRKSKN